MLFGHCLCRPAKQMRFCLFLYFTIITDIKVDSLLARFTPFREEHSRHQVAVTTPSSVGPPVIKQQARTNNHSSEGAWIVFKSGR